MLTCHDHDPAHPRSVAALAWHNHVASAFWIAFRLDAGGRLSAHDAADYCTFSRSLGMSSEKSTHALVLSSSALRTLGSSKRITKLSGPCA